MLVNDSYREQLISVPAAEVYALPIDLSSKPNYLIFMNHDSNDLYVSDSPLISTSNYLFIVPANGIRNYGKPFPIEKLYVYSAAVKKFTLYSMEKDFEAGMLQPSHIGIDPNENLVTLSGSLTEHTFHAGAKAAANGTDMDVSKLKTVGVYLSGDSTARTWKFWGSIDGTNFTALVGTKEGDTAFTTAIQTTGIAETWIFDVGTYKLLRIELDAITAGANGDSADGNGIV
jgi:hypothetical protein